MLKQYIGPYDEVRVVVAGIEVGRVKQGESLAIPDEVADSVTWPDTLWQDNAPAAIEAPKDSGSENERGEA